MKLQKQRLPILAALVVFFAISSVGPAHGEAVLTCSYTSSTPCCPILSGPATGWDVSDFDDCTNSCSPAGDGPEVLSLPDCGLLP